MKKILGLLILILSLSFTSFAQQPRKVAINDKEAQALGQAYVNRQQAQAKLEEAKKRKQKFIDLLDADIKQAETEDQNAIMGIQNITLQLGNTYKFDPAEYDPPTAIDNKIVFIEKQKAKEAEKPKEGK